MSDTIQEYEAMRIALKQNITIIKDLIQQAESYRKIISTLDDDATKERFEKNVEDIFKTIDSLVKQTDYMFYQYTKLAQANIEAKTA